MKLGAVGNPYLWGGSRPSRGAWIETSVAQSLTPARYVAPLAGRVD